MTAWAGNPQAAQIDALLDRARKLTAVEIELLDAARGAPWYAERYAAWDVVWDVVNEVCDNCGSPLVVVRSRAGRFCTSECAEAFELS